MAPKRKFVITQVVEFVYTVFADDEEAAIDMVQNLDWNDNESFNVLEEVADEDNVDDDSFQKVKDGKVEDL